jgi:hypothetical protein
VDKTSCRILSNMVEARLRAPLGMRFTNCMVMGRKENPYAKGNAGDAGGVGDGEQGEAHIASSRKPGGNGEWGIDEGKGGRPEPRQGGKERLNPCLRSTPVEGTRWNMEAQTEQVPVVVWEWDITNEMYNAFKSEAKQPMRL